MYALKSAGKLNFFEMAKCSFKYFLVDHFIHDESLVKKKELRLKKYQQVFQKKIKITLSMTYE